MNPNWIRTTVASILLAILLKAGLHVPFFTTFLTLSIIYVLHVVRAEMGKGVDTLGKWAVNAGKVVMGVVIFLALRFLAAKATGLYPIGTYGEIDDAGGLFGILPSKNISNIILWEIVFAFVAGQITVMWVKKTHKTPVRAVIVASLVILTIQLTFPTTKVWPSKDEAAKNIEEVGTVGATLKAGWKFAFGKIGQSKPASTNSPASLPTTATLTKATVLRFDGFTPCEPPIQFAFELDTQGDPISLKFPGVDRTLEYSGKGTINAPTNRLSGPVNITSLDPQKQARVRIWEVVTIRQ